MTEKVDVWAEGVAKPFGHFSQAIKMGDMIYLSGQLPLDPATGKPVGGEFPVQAKQVLDNLTAILAACGGNLGNVMKATLYLVDLRDYPEWDKLAKEYFYFLPPALTTVTVPSLPGGCRLCLDGIAELKPSEAPAGTSML